MLWNWSVVKIDFSWKKKLCKSKSDFKPLLLIVFVYLGSLQGCQKVYFQTKNPNMGKFWRALIYFTAIWNILWPFGTACVRLVHFSGFGIVWREKSGKPGSLCRFYDLIGHLWHRKPLQRFEIPNLFSAVDFIADNGPVLPDGVKIQIWVNLGGPWNVGIFWGPFCLFYGYYGIDYDHLVHFVVMWYIFSCFGILYRERSGNHVMIVLQRLVTSSACKFLLEPSRVTRCVCEKNRPKCNPANFFVKINE
jgi:hypothetical protein